MIGNGNEQKRFVAPCFDLRVATDVGGGVDVADAVEMICLLGSPFPPQQARGAMLGPTNHHGIASTF
jgi:hypothetical protein